MPSVTLECMSRVITRSATVMELLVCRQCDQKLKMEVLEADQSVLVHEQVCVVNQSESPHEQVHVTEEDVDLAPQKIKMSTTESKQFAKVK